LPILVDLHVSLDLVVWISDFDLILEESGIGVPKNVSTARSCINVEEDEVCATKVVVATVELPSDHLIVIFSPPLPST
jgi:hypothetical protein